MTRLAVGFLLAAGSFAQSTAQDALRLNDEGNRASEHSDYIGAARLFRESAAIWSSLGSAFDAHRAGTLMNLGTVLCGAGKRVEAGPVFGEALALHRRTLGARHRRTLTNMNLLAANYLMLGDVDKGEALLNEALPIARADFPDDIQTARSLEVQTGVLDRRGKTSEAVAPAEEALTIALRVEGEESLEAALAYSNAAEAHRASGHFDRALPLYRKAHATYEKFLGPNHPRVASILSQEGLMAMYEGKLSTAEQTLERAIQILKLHCPDCLVELAIAENNLGLLRIRQKRYHEAGAMLEDALALRYRFSPNPTPDLAGSMQALALARKLEHRDADAASLNQRAAAILAFR
ncbi:MAG TPA: tetratricopeptide repeat protein [Candidatus Acidoferrales bacterium]|nr:tetratricopeptide repeat protein [Candidatus Acidoferrales bacterium]